MKRYVVYVDEDAGEDVRGAQVLGEADVRAAMRVMKRTCEVVPSCRECAYEEICKNFDHLPSGWRV